jgi:hypothetical protein
LAVLKLQIKWFQISDANVLAVIPAKAGIQYFSVSSVIPAFAHYRQVKVLIRY